MLKINAMPTGGKAYSTRFAMLNNIDMLAFRTLNNHGTR